MTINTAIITADAMTSPDHPVDCLVDTMIEAQRLLGQIKLEHHHPDPGPRHLPRPRRNPRTRHRRRHPTQPRPAGRDPDLDGAVLTPRTRA